MSPLTTALIFTPWWPAFGAPLANHLWQSTLFAAVAALLALLLKNNHARARHMLWFLASAKFLIPFALLISIGSHLGWSKVPAATQPELFWMMQDFGQPFAQAKSIQHAASSPATALATYALPMFFLFVWLCGFLAVLFYWWSRFRRIRAAVRGLHPINSGREFEALRRAASSESISRPIDLILCKSTLEPGILGVFRPALLLPAGISSHLNNAQLAAVITHELCHVRRRDNLTASLHMLVEALFWFYPLVWWLGARLVDERERACDEEVLRLGGDPQTYAESILKICEFYLESPLFCAAGVTGSNLKKRIEVIMQNRAPLNLDLARKLLLALAGFAAVALPLAFGLLHATQTHAQSQSNAVTPAFGSVYLQLNTTGEPMPGLTVIGRPAHAIQFRPDRFMATNVSLKELIRLAYHTQDSQISGAPDWLTSDKYDVEAKLSSTELEKLLQLPSTQRTEAMRSNIQGLLADRFKLVVHRETKVVPIYALVLSSTGPQLHPAKPGDTYADGVKGLNGHPIGPGALVLPETNKLVCQAVPISHFVEWMAALHLGRPLVDMTGLAGSYDFTLLWSPDPSAGPVDSSLSAALEQQLGLKLQPQVAPLEILVVDRAEKPTATASVSIMIAPGQAQPPTEPVAVSSTKVVLGDLKIEGKVHDPEGVRDRILNAWKDREYGNAQRLMDAVAEQGIRRDFQDRGYFKVVVNPANFKIFAGDADGKLSLRMTVSVTEGNQYRLGTLSVQSDQPDRALVIPAETLRDQFHLHTGDIFNASEIRSGMNNVMTLYHSKGYSDSVVDLNSDFNEVQQLVNITLHITEGHPTT